MTVLGRFKLVIASTAFVIAAACGATTGTSQAQSASQGVITPPTALEQSVPDANVEPANLPSSDGYKLGNGDTLRITVFGEPDLSGEFQVDGTGVISMPLIGEITAVGKTVRQVQRDMETMFRDGYLNNPRISAEVINFRPYYILGEVGRPGEYPYTDGLTVLNAVATAGGFTYRANKKVVFVRSADGSAEHEVRLTSSTEVTPGDTIRIGERLF